METTADTTSVRREVAIAASPETVWEFLVDPDKAVRWMGVAADLDPRPGGQYRVEVLPGQVARGEFVELDRPRRAVWTWGWDPGTRSALPPGASNVATSPQRIAHAARTVWRFIDTPFPQVVVHSRARAAMPLPGPGLGNLSL